MDKKEEMVRQNMGLVHALAAKFKGRGIEYDDLFQAGCVGLIKAIDGFEPERGFKFSTYAVPVILGEIKRLFRDGGSLKVSRSLKEISIKINRFVHEFLANNGYEPTICEIAKNLNIDKNQVVEAMNAAELPISLTSTDEYEQGQIDVPIESYDEKIAELIALKQIVGQLEKQDRSIIILRFFKSQTQTQTAKVLGMSQVQVSRREKIILETLRKKLIS